MAAAILVPGSHEPDPEPGEVERGLDELDRYLAERTSDSNVRDVGAGVIALEQYGGSRRLGHIAGSSFISPIHPVPPFIE